jgi:pilus assembly protein TadC
MEYIYIVVENGTPYSTAFKTYKLAVDTVKETHKEYLEEQMKELYYLEDIEHLLKDINVPENTETGISHLYIEKGINIWIHKLPIK